MALIERLIGAEDPKIPVHQFLAATAEFVRGRATSQQVIDFFQLTPEEATEAQSLAARVTSGPTGSRLNREEIHDVLMLAEHGIGYTTAQSVRTRLGI